jgi:hypothetical protein
MIVKPPLAPIARRVPQALTHLKLVERMAAWWGRLVMSRAGARYADMNHALNDQIQINDIAMGVACRVILERAPTRIVEIGTYDGRRIATLKRLFPAIDCVGLDIQAAFETPREAFGVAFRRFDLAEMAALDATSLVVSIGTLSCMTREELGAFLDTLRPTGAALVFLELTPGYRHGESLRRNSNSWFHDYDVVLPAHGFSLSGGMDTGRSGHLDLNEFDLRYVNVAVPVSGAR